MLKRFSIARKGGIELMAYIPKDVKNPLNNPQLISGFMDALITLSEVVGTPIRQVSFLNMILYIKTYGTFALQMLVDEKLDDHQVDSLFEQIAKEIALISDLDEKHTLADNEACVSRIKTILAPLTRTPLIGSIYDLKEDDTVSTIALVGLGNAGKTSIKNVFFESWTSDMVKQVKATMGVQTTSKLQEFLEHQFAVLDFGGQAIFRGQYVKQVKRWEGVTALIFVVDIQNADEFETARNYLKEIWQVVTAVNERKPRLSIFLHKYDIDRRESIKDNISKCLLVFKEFIDLATFYLTTISDTSSNIAMIKALYFSLPDVIIKRLLMVDFIDHFEREILPGYSALTRADNYQEEFEELKTGIRRQAILIGMDYGQSLQEKWLRSLMGELDIKQRYMTARSVEVKQKGPSLSIRIQNWADRGIPKSLTTVLLDGMLEGMLKTFQITDFRLTDETDHYTTWIVDLS
ncbi:MAG: ADP-ribosylation factor-like protein [Candidatus Odinarchaeota archaeon]